MPFLQSNHIRLHYLDSGDSPGQPVFLMLHGVTANAHAFDGILQAGLSSLGRCIRVDLRGRGLSDHPQGDYGIPDHAADITGLMDVLELQRVVLIGHSYGALLSFYLCAHFPERFERMVAMDAAARLNPKVGEMLGNRFAMLDKIFPSKEEYMQAVRTAPYNTFWDEAMQPYYDADIREAEGGVTPRSTVANIIACSVGLGKIDWPMEIEAVRQPVLMIHAPDVYNLGEVLLPEDFARETLLLLRQGSFAQVPGNHQTMLYRAGAAAIVAAIRNWLTSPGK